MQLEKKLTNKMSALVTNELLIKFDDSKNEIVAAVMMAYDTELVVLDRKSKTNPQEAKYREEFEKRLNEFEYVEKEQTKIVFKVPDMDNFDFSGNTMRVIEQILEGTAGIYVEVSADDYEKMFGKKVLTREPLDTSVPKKELVYLMRYSNRIRVAERNTFGRVGYLTRYPFSNVPPIPILEEADKVINTNLEKWIDSAVNTATRKFKQTT